MPVVNVDELVRLQRKPEDIRNVRFLSHPMMSHEPTANTRALDLHSGPRCKSGAFALSPTESSR